MKKITLLIGIFLFAGKVFSQTPSTDDIVISGDVVWDNQNYEICGNIIITSGSKLSLIPGIRVAMQEGKKIIVQRNAELEVDSATITSSGNVLWKGIELWGQYNQLQSYTYQGAVKIINSSTIENAEVAINTIKFGLPDGGNGSPQPEYSGGMVLCDRGIFRNNNIAVKFWPYDHTSSQSFFRNCQFITDNNMLADTDPDVFLMMTDISGIKISGCSFTDEQSNASFYESTTGIRATNAKFGVWQFASQPSVFSGLYYGIYATATTPLNFIKVLNSDFINNYRGIFISGMESLAVESNNFSINSPFRQFNGGYGLYLDYCTGYKVEENNFFHEGGTQNGVGLVVNHSGKEPNQIYRNWFSNLECGMDIQGENRDKDGTGLELKCNQYEDTRMDKIITWESPFVTPFAGVASNQGSSSSNPEDMAGNLFQIDGLTPNGDFDDMLNEANHIIYYWPINNNDIRVKPVDYTANVTPKEINVGPNWSFINGCPPSEEPGGGGGAIGDTRDQMASAGQKVDSTENLLALLIDGGETEATRTVVDNSVPPETMKVYNDLMDKSPYLSDTVVSTAIEKEDVLPGAMIRDIMVANPKAAKSEQLLEKLDQRWNPLPEYMKAQILAGRSIVSIREETESRLAAFKLEKAKHFNTLVRYYLADTVSPQASFDSLTYLLQNENSLKAKYSLAMLSMENGALTEGLAVCNAIPAQFNLSPAEAEAHSQITAYYTLLSDMAQQGKSVFEADSSQLAVLTEMETNQKGMASVYARNILLALSQTEYDEPIILPDLLKSSAALDDYNKLLSKANDAPGYMKVKPNPAKDYIIIEYEFEKKMDANVEIRDISGILKFSKNTTGKQDQLTIDTRSWKAGIYITSLKINGKLIDSVKFTIVN